MDTFNRPYLKRLRFLASLQKKVWPSAFGAVAFVSDFWHLAGLALVLGAVVYMSTLRNRE